MELTAFIKIITLVMGFIAFVYLIAWVFQGMTEDERLERRRAYRFLPRLGRRKKSPHHKEHHHHAVTHGR